MHGLHPHLLFQPRYTGMVVGGCLMGILEEDPQMLLFCCPCFSSTHPPLLRTVTILVSDQSQINKVAVVVCHGDGQPGSAAHSRTYLEQVPGTGAHSPASLLPGPNVL